MSAQQIAGMLAVVVVLGFTAIRIAIALRRRVYSCVNCGTVRIDRGDGGRTYKYPASPEPLFACRALGHKWNRDEA